MKKNIIFSIITIFAMMISSCDDFLSQEATGILPEEEFYLNDEDAMFAVSATYDALSNTYSQAWNSLYLLKILPSDDSNAGGSDGNDQLHYQTLDDFNHDSENEFVRGVWNRLYTVIVRANKVIDNLPVDTDLQKRLVAEAKALRAYSHFELVSLWGDVPLVTTSLVAADFSTTGRTPKEEVYAQIETDLLDAITLLPLKSEYSDGDKFRFSKGAAQALLGRVYLYQEKWSDAVTQLEAVISSDEYELENTIASVFALQNKFGKESLFEMNYITTEQYSWDNFPWNIQESNIIIQLMGPREGIYVKAPTDSLLEGWGFNTPTKKIYDAFVTAEDETRRLQTLMSVEELKDMGGDFNDTNLHDFEGLIRRKYGTFSTASGGPDTPLNYGTGFKIIRYADVLLMAAEAHYRNTPSNETKAREYINEVRQRPGTNLSAVTVSGDELFDAIVLERQLELAFEGFRYPDLVRWGMAADELEGFIPNKHELFPIPNNDVVGGNLEQNPGF